MGLLFEAGWLSLLFEYLIKSSLILSVSIAMAFFLRKKSAGLRHLVLSVFLIGLLFLPVLSTFTAGWETKFLPSRDATNDIAFRAEHLIGTVNNSAKTLESSSSAARAPLSREAGTGDIRRSLGMFLERSKPIFGFAVLWMWVFVSVFLFFRILLGFCGAGRLAREGQELQDSLWKRLLSRFLESVSLKRKIKLLSHDKTLVPLTWGVINPVVMMPSESKNWNKNQRSAALYHELSHVKRGDYLVMILARISRAIYWFNPLSWIVLGMVKREQEKACDELVLKAGIKPSTYAENLLFIRRSASGHWIPPAAILGAVNRSNLNDRLTTILKRRFILEEVRMRTKVLLSFLAILSISFIGLARPGNSSSTRAEAVSYESAVVNPLIDSYEIPVDVQDREKNEQKKEIEKSVVREEKDQGQEKKEQEKKIQKGVKIEGKEKKEEKATFVWTTTEGKKGTYEIIIDKDDPQKIVLVTSPHVTHDNDKSVTWTIKADKLALSDDAKKIELDEGTVIYFDEDQKDGKKVIKLISPTIQVKKVGKNKEHVVVDVQMSPHVEVRPNVHIVIDSEKYKELIQKIKQKLEKLKAKDLEADMKEIELKAIEEILDELQKALEKKYEKAEHIAVHVSPEASHSYKIRTKDIHLDHDKVRHAIAIRDDKNTSFLVYQADLDPDQIAAYKKALKRLEDKLPEGYTVESSIDEDEGKLFLKITKEKDAPEDVEAIKKLIEEFQEELAKIK